MRIQTNINLAAYTTFRLGGTADFFAVARNNKDIAAAADFAKKNKLPILVLGAGSNVVISDDGVRGIVVKPELKDVRFGRDGTCTAEAGAMWDAVVAMAVRHGYGGIENLSLIPGTVGGAVYQNIGAYGAELKDVVRRVRVFDRKNKNIKWLSSAECRFGYRTSMFREDPSRRYIILAAELKLKKNHKFNLLYPDLAGYFVNKEATLPAVRRAVIRIRRAKLPYPPQVRNAGSFFKNPVLAKSKVESLKSKVRNLRYRDADGGQYKLSAAQLIEMAGWKGKRVGNVGVSDKHALVLVNYGGGTAKELTELADAIKSDIKERFGVVLESEVQLVTSA